MVMETLTEIDRAALERAIQLTLVEPDAGRVEQVRSMLEQDDWLDVEFCSYHRQCRELGLKPWESPPSCLENDFDDLESTIAGGPRYNRDFAAAIILKEMVALGISKFDPTPLASVELAKRHSRTALGQMPEGSGFPR